ncbi:hypothetical protein [Bacillus sp. EAC]|uniref:hypothetical protein n=1 Tax=Bacillus sp. EAC TaxID=1978338 RepID=UPI000B4381C1|nr:hypothetical protein [Bacillus sp. EAC]
MRKLIVLFCGIFLVSLSFWTLYYGYSPKVGVIGNGPNDKLIWFQFGTQFLSGICALFLAFNLRKK